MRKTIAQLKDRLASQDQKIAQLEGELSSAKGQIESLNNQVAEGQEQLKTETEAKEAAQQEAQVANEQAVAAANEANRVYYAIGSNKELKNKGLLEKKFLGATKVLKGDFDAAYFVTADKRTLTSIPTSAKRVKIWTNMPEGSYRITGEKDGPKTVEITDPAKFWSLSNHLIIQTD